MYMSVTIIVSYIYSCIGWREGEFTSDEQQQQQQQSPAVCALYLPTYNFF